MPKIIVEKPFPFSPDGKSVVQIEKGEQDVSERCATVAVEHLKVAKKAGDKPRSPRSKDRPGTDA